jgi:hypothetical protein
MKKNIPLVDLGCYIAAQCGRERAFDRAIKIAEKLQLPTIAIEELLVSVSVAKRYGVSEDLKEKARKYLKEAGILRKVDSWIKTL